MLRREFFAVVGSWLGAVTLPRWMTRGKPKPADMTLLQGRAPGMRSMPTSPWTWEVFQTPKPVPIPTPQAKLSWEMRRDSPSDFYLFSDGIQVGVWCIEGPGYWQTYNAATGVWGPRETCAPYQSLPSLPQRMPIGSPVRASC